MSAFPLVKTDDSGRVVNKPSLVCRTVKRWFWYGKGYATQRLACRAMAKRELGYLIHQSAWETIKHLQTEKFVPVSVEDIHAAFARMFPLHPLGTRGYNDKHRWNVEGETHGFCNACRWDWINNRTDELLAEFTEAA
jgi:hypothetical protein